MMVPTNDVPIIMVFSGKPVFGTVLSGVRIDYRQETNYKYSPDDTFSGRGRKTSFEYDESVRSVFLRQNRSPQSSDGSDHDGFPWLSTMFPQLARLDFHAVQVYTIV